MDDATSGNTKQQRRTVRDFSRKNFVLLILVLLVIPTIYLFWYLSSVGGGTVLPAPGMSAAPGSESVGQTSIYAHVLQSGWKATVKLLPYAVGQYLLGLQCDINQNFLWASSSLLAIGVLTLIQIFDVLLNPELQTGGKIVWSVLMAVFAALGAPVPHFIYWFQYMWTEADRSTSTDSASSAPASA